MSPLQVSLLVLWALSSTAHAQGIPDPQGWDWWIYEGCAPPPPDGPILEGTLSGTRHYYGLDQSSSTRTLSSPGGIVLEYVEYDDFGTPTLLDGNGEPVQGEGTGNPYLFRAMRYDDETGFYFNERTGSIYDPATGRHLNRNMIDSLGNAYRASRNNPWSAKAEQMVNQSDGARSHSSLIVGFLSDMPRPTHPNEFGSGGSSPPDACYWDFPPTGPPPTIWDWTWLDEAVRWVIDKGTSGYNCKQRVQLAYENCREAGCDADCCNRNRDAEESMCWTGSSGPESNAFIGICCSLGAPGPDEDEFGTDCDELSGAMTTACQATTTSGEVYECQCSGFLECEQDEDGECQCNFTVESITNCQ